MDVLVFVLAFLLTTVFAFYFMDNALRRFGVEERVSCLVAMVFGALVSTFLPLSVLFKITA